MVDVPVVTQRQVPSTQTAHRTVEIPKVQFVDRVVDIIVHLQRSVSHDSERTENS